MPSEQKKASCQSGHLQSWCQTRVWWPLLPLLNNVWRRFHAEYLPQRQRNNGHVGTNEYDSASRCIASCLCSYATCHGGTRAIRWRLVERRALKAQHVMSAAIPCEMCRRRRDNRWALWYRGCIAGIRRECDGRRWRWQWHQMAHGHEKGQP